MKIFWIGIFAIILIEINAKLVNLTVQNTTDDNESEIEVYIEKIYPMDNPSETYP